MRSFNFDIEQYFECTRTYVLLLNLYENRKLTIFYEKTYFRIIKKLSETCFIIESLDNNMNYRNTWLITRSQLKLMKRKNFRLRLDMPYSHEFGLV